MVACATIATTDSLTDIADGDWGGFTNRHVGGLLFVLYSIYRFRLTPCYILGSYKLQVAVEHARCYQNAVVANRTGSQRLAHAYETLLDPGRAQCTINTRANLHNGVSVPQH